MLTNQPPQTPIDVIRPPETPIHMNRMPTTPLNGRAKSAKPNRTTENIRGNSGLGASQKSSKDGPKVSTATGHYTKYVNKLGKSYLLDNPACKMIDNDKNTMKIYPKI